MTPFKLAFAAWLLLTPIVFGAETNHDFTKWEKEIAAYQAADATNPPPKHALLFLGSSTIRMWSTLARDFPDHQVINRGVGGCEIVDCTHFADQIVFPYEPRMIFFRCGGNDLWNGKTPENVYEDFKEFAAKVHGRLPKTEIIFISWNPTVARWSGVAKEKALNELVETFSRTNSRVHYLETGDISLGADGKPRPELFREDGLHFNDAGYKLLAERVRPLLRK